MRRGTRAADDGSFSRSAGTAAVRGAALIIVAVLLGFVLLRATESDDAPFAAAATDDADDGDDDGQTDITDPGDTTGTTDPGTTPSTRPLSEVRVLVVNGTTTSGRAGGLSTQLGGFGYVVDPPVDATEKPQNTAVYYSPGYEAEAQFIADRLDPPPPVSPISAEVPATVGAANVVIIIGTDLVG